MTLEERLIALRLSIGSKVRLVKDMTLERIPSLEPMYGKVATLMEAEITEGWILVLVWVPDFPYHATVREAEIEYVE